MTFALVFATAFACWVKFQKLWIVPFRNIACLYQQIVSKIIIAGNAILGLRIPLMYKSSGFPKRRLKEQFFKANFFLYYLYLIR